MQTVFSLFIALLLSAEAEIGGTVLYESALIIPEEQFADLKTSDPKKYREFMAFANEIAEAVAQIDYSLVFNEKAALFKAEEILGKDTGMLGSLQSSTGTFYNNLFSGERIQQLEDQGRTYLISREPLEWEITGETKQIAGHTCRKAVATQNFYSHRTKENKVQEIEAWFAPGIPASFGPKGFSGLPGLILDLSFAQEHIYATEIELDDTGAAIAKPEKGKKVSFREYQAIRAGLGEKFREFNGF